MIEVVEKMLRNNTLSIDKIAFYLELPIEFVQEIANKMKK
jgi:hypothetical protein